MKTIFGLLCLLALTFEGIAGEKGSNPSNLSGKVKFEDLRKPIVIKLSPLHFFDRSIQVNGELFKKNFKTSLLLGFTGTYRSDKEVIDKGGSLEIQFRHYPRTFRADTNNWYRNSAAGFYVGLSASVGVNAYTVLTQSYVSSTQTLEYSTTANSQWVTPSVLIGYQLIVWESMYLDFYVGGGIKLNNVEKSTNIPGADPDDQLNNTSLFSRYYTGVLPKLGFTLGIGL